MKNALMVGLWMMFATTTEELNESGERGTLVLYRRKDYFSSDFTLKINNQEVSQKFSNNEYIRVDVPAGRLKIETEGGFITQKQNMAFSVLPNEIVYLKGIVDYDYLSNALYFKRTDAEQATREMSKTKLDETALRRIE